ncbi:MAG: PD40 domain-containing protein [Muribaculaceae bacterium]|nr:PD40 domain-containing protein [Muribaculaceae bacterium]
MKRNIFIGLAILLCATGINAQKAPAAVDAGVVLDHAMEALMKYDFSATSNYLSQFKKLPEATRLPYQQEYEELQRGLEIAENAIDRVEKIVVIDSVTVNRADFYKAYRLPASAGYLVAGSQLKEIADMPENAVAHVNEAKDYVLWSFEDESGDVFLKESILLNDGKWLTEEIVIDSPENVEIYGYPFVAQDGQTIYFSGKGEGSMGGYDIYVIQRDPVTGEFLNPLNLGMPFNSPADDILMALDEENGIGWWATARNSMGDEDTDDITVYTYLLNDIRQNYPDDTDDLEELARISDYRMTWPEGMENKITNVLKHLPEAAGYSKKSSPEFTLRMPKGKVYHKYSDFKNKKAAEVMKEYLKKKKELTARESELKKLRANYSSQGKASAEQILKSEQTVAALQKDVNDLLSQVYKLEKSAR